MAGGAGGGRGSAFNKDEDHDEHFRRCWHLTNCKDCLAKEDDCSWCPFSWSCVPNSNRLVPFLAPAWDEDICPHWAERWELRTRPLGCQVSTITTLTSLVTIACTLLLVLLGFVFVFGVRRIRGFTRRNPRWWRGRLGGGGGDDGDAGLGAGSFGGGGEQSLEQGQARMEGLIQRLRWYKSRDEAARREVEANGVATGVAREREPLLGNGLNQS
ncbi:uncharacterized protein B0I36DRAFT_360305 [Microdochium trichocladiopsis]|uniref:PSI domain-containing protein n=1 Tax=Microdochium trichocladiopsis TaxID=1682393 RepID=A0A9P8YBI1_9PEZI|nr:uncharacterized protein B0I36DRAFT_360305 [Microdochium trichocladiopsis]KAH7034835.1 hypothetical protein B0I36DRAFT_360305 [Microdochium trichocladiopsis]